LVFATPTTFRQGDADLPLPVPRLVFRGLWEKWNAFAPQSSLLSEEVIERKIALAEAQIRTRTFDEGRSSIVGFVGWAEFYLMGRHSLEVIRSLHALAEFAFFAGVGRKSTHGMGLVRHAR